MDTIQRKLELIDKQLAPRDLHRQAITTAPLLFAAIGLIAGVLLQDALSSVADHRQLVWIWASLLGLCIAAVIASSAVRSTNLKPRSAAYIALICFICLGAIRVISYNHLPANDISSFVAEEPKLARVRGVVATEPHTENHSDWAFARFKPTDPTSSFYLKLTEAKAVNGWTEVAGAVRVQVDEPVLDIKAGDCIEAYCMLSRFRSPTNPGQFDTAKHLAKRNIFVAASVKSRGGIELLESMPVATFAKIRARIRQAASRALLDSLPADGSGRGMLQALLLGYRGEIDSETYRAFRRTGLLHFVSLSGMHFGILVGIVWWLCKTAGLMKPARAVVCIFAIALFLMVVPARAPTLRAAVLGWVFCGSFLFRRYPNSLNTLSLAAIILLLIRPSQLFEAGWQLSFGTVLGIILLEPPIGRAIRDAVERLACELDYRQMWKLAVMLRKAVGGPVSMLAVGLAAWLGGAGILLYHFGTVTPLASMWTVLVFPLVAAILTLGFSKILLFFLLPTLSGILGVVVAGLSETLIWVVKLISMPDFLHILIGHVSLWPVVLYYCFIAAGFFVRFRRPLVKKAVCGVMVLVILVVVGGIKWQRSAGNDLVVTCLDVSHGQAVFAEFPDYGNALFDAGSLTVSDVGRRIVAPFLRYKGIGGIDAIFISHNDIDHINGIPEIALGCRVERVYANEAFFEDVGQWGAAKYLEEQLGGSGLEIERAMPEPDFGSRASVRNLWPTEQSGRAVTLSENDKSLVTLIEFAGRKILLCSDIEKAAQKEILRLNPELRADVVIAPHHGSMRTSDPEFIKSLEPEVLIHSCGRREYENLPEGGQVDSVRRLYTPRDGAVSVRIGRDGSMRIETAARRD